MSNGMATSWTALRRTRIDNSCRQTIREDLNMSTTATSTAEDSLARRRRDGRVVSAGHLVATALKAAGVDTNVTLDTGRGLGGMV
jgi:hypothetical protein